MEVGLYMVIMEMDIGMDMKKVDISNPCLICGDLQEKLEDAKKEYAISLGLRTSRNSGSIYNFLVVNTRFGAHFDLVVAEWNVKWHNHVGCYRRTQWYD